MCVSLLSHRSASQRCGRTEILGSCWIFLLLVTCTLQSRKTCGYKLLTFNCRDWCRLFGCYFSLATVRRLDFNTSQLQLRKKFVKNEQSVMSRHFLAHNYAFFRLNLNALTFQLCHVPNWVFSIADFSENVHNGQFPSYAICVEYFNHFMSISLSTSLHCCRCSWTFCTSFKRKILDKSGSFFTQLAISFCGIKVKNSNFTSFCMLRAQVIAIHISTVCS